MANPEHVAIVKQGPEAIRQWQTTQRAAFERLDLSQADLRGANLGQADLTKANLDRADLTRATLIGTNLTKANLTRANLQQADLSIANLQTATLREANLEQADLYAATLRTADLTQANLTEVNLTEANIQHANLRQANLAKATLNHLEAAPQARHLDTVELSGGDAYHFDTCLQTWGGWSERWLNWERLRLLGRLPLLGASYTALLFMLIVFAGLAFYNDKVALLRAWATYVVPTPEHPLHRFALLVAERLQPQPIPRLSLVLLLSTVLLAIASTLYTLCCPSRIKEFSREQWCDQLGRSLLHYWPLAWKYRWIRLICAACYVLGGVGVLWVIGAKVWATGVFIVKHSVVTWPWQ
jgi:uncharacterized protein YjbI with pentapeptide repeats